MISGKGPIKIHSATVRKHGDNDPLNNILVFINASDKGHVLTVDKNDKSLLKTALVVINGNGIKFSDGSDEHIVGISFKVKIIASNKTGELVRKISLVDEGFDYQVISCGITATTNMALGMCETWDL